MSARALLGLTLLIFTAAGIAIEHVRETSHSATPAGHGAFATEAEGGEGSVEGLSQTALEQRLDQLEKELSAGSSGFPSSGHDGA